MLNAMELQRESQSATKMKITTSPTKSRNPIYTRTKKHLQNEQRSRDAAAKKRANTSGVGKSNNYCEDIYIPPYNNTH